MFFWSCIASRWVSVAFNGGSTGFVCVLVWLSGFGETRFLQIDGPL